MRNTNSTNSTNKGPKINYRGNGASTPTFTNAVPMPKIKPAPIKKNDKK